MTQDVVVVGLSHRTAPVEVRERLAIPADHHVHTLRDLLRDGPISESVLISTCNRVELVAAASDAQIAARAALRFFQSRTARDLPDLERHIYARTGGDAVRHLFRVAAGLDSMVLGEPQILGQVKEAVQTASTAGTLGTLLGRCFDHAFSVAKRVRTETGLAAGHVSVSSIACDLAEQIFGDLLQRHVMLLGAGKMSEVAAKSLANRGAQLFVVNRSEARAQALAQACGGTPRQLESLASELVEADVVISSTANPHFVVSYELMQDVVKARRRRPIFLIDIAVPRDVDPRVAMLDNVFLYDIDDLQRVSQENLAARRHATEDAEHIIGHEVSRFETWRRSLQLTPTIVALRERFRGVVLKELEQTLPRLSGLEASDRKALERMCEAAVNKLLHGPLTELKRDVDHEDHPQLIEATRRLFQLQAAGEALDAGRAAPEIHSEGARHLTAHPGGRAEKKVETEADTGPLPGDASLAPAGGRGGGAR